MENKKPSIKTSVLLISLLLFAVVAISLFLSDSVKSEPEEDLEEILLNETNETEAVLNETVVEEPVEEVINESEVVEEEPTEEELIVDEVPLEE